ncbi:haloacid dehalogenase [bacterium endosymbiont of Escarpia laminata]|nr:MAG: haloacid dehalogenase [bacterium endosymbiont of Escarpia laminata]RLJ20846.1 MAG: haloacid dehalogenase [bacterium endosymbiont of Escarpia laminata]
MSDRLLICTDLDRTLIPNGPQPESPDVREHFALLVARPEVTLAYVSGRHRALVEQAIADTPLPLPDFVVGDVGTTIYYVSPQQEWQRQAAWEEEIARDWQGMNHAGLEVLLADLPALELQESAKQNSYKLSYYVALQQDRDTLSVLINQRLASKGVKARLIWSTDEAACVGLLDVLPARASKYHALEALMSLHGFDYGNTVFCGDSGNDIEVLASPVPAVLVANSEPDVQDLARRLADDMGQAAQLYIAKGNFMGLNGNYSAGMLEGIAHYHPQSIKWMGYSHER